MQRVRSADGNKSWAMIPWSEFESCLTWHMDAEEHYLLPLAEAAHAEQVSAIRDEHAAIRKLVAELGVLVDLHALGEQSTAELVRLLHEHAALEEATLYGWADQGVSTAVGRSIAAMLHLGRRALGSDSKPSSGTEGAASMPEERR